MPGRGRAIPARRDGFRPGRAPSCGDTFPRIRFPMLASTLNFLAGGLLQFGWGEMLLYLLVATQLTIFAVTLYLHRSQAHRGVDFHPAIAHFFRFWRSEEHTSELQSLMRISYAVFCLKKKTERHDK